MHCVVYLPFRMKSRMRYASESISTSIRVVGKGDGLDDLEHGELLLCLLHLLLARVLALGFSLFLLLGLFACPAPRLSSSLAFLTYRCLAMLGAGCLGVCLPAANSV